MIKYDLYEYIIKLLIKGYNVEQISFTLGLEKKFIIKSLRALKTHIIIEFDEDNFYIVKQIDSLIGFHRKSLNNNEKKLCQMIDHTDTYLMKEMKLNKYKYLSYLKSCYYILYSYDRENNECLLSKIRTKILNNDIKRNENFISKKINNRESNAIVRKSNGEVFVLDSPVGKTIDLGNNDLKFVLMSDTHLGSCGENLNYINEAYDYAIKNEINYIFITGDLIEGSYHNYVRCKDKYKSIESQLNHVLNDFPNDKNIKTIILFGNHDLYPFLTNKIDIYQYLNNRDDFLLLGYRNGYIKINNSYIELKHEIEKVVNAFYVDNPFLSLIGHSHQFRCTYSNDSIFLKAPTTSDIFGNKEYVINKGFIVGNVSFNNNIINYVSLEYINFEGNNIKLEKVLK